MLPQFLPPISSPLVSSPSSPPFSPSSSLKFLPVIPLHNYFSDQVSQVQDYVVLKLVGIHNWLDQVLCTGSVNQVLVQGIVHKRISHSASRAI